MSSDAFVGLLVLCGVATPAAVWFILRRWGGLRALPRRVWFTLYVLGFIFCVVVAPRKHWERAIVMIDPRSFWALNLAQLDNGFWEELGKLAALLIGLWLFGNVLRPLLSQKRPALALGYWVGLAYGAGEAVLLAVLFTYPSWAPLFGWSTFVIQVIGWEFVLDRLLAVHLHAVFGALVALGLYGYLALGSKRRLVAFFVLAAAYHQFVDGLAIAAAVSPALARFLMGFSGLLLPLLVVAGWLLLWPAYRLAGAEPARPTQAQADREAPS